MKKMLMGILALSTLVASTFSITTGRTYAVDTSIFTRTFGGTEHDEFLSVKQVSDGGYIAVGSSESSYVDLPGNKGKRDGIIVRYDVNGNVLWKKNFGGSENDFFTDVLVSSDGGFIVTGYFSSIDGDFSGISKGNYGSRDGLIIKYNASGNVLWKKSFGGSLGSDDLYSIKATADGGFVVAGSSNSVDGDLGGLRLTSTNAVIAKYNSAGSIQWVKPFGQQDVWLTYNSISQTSDGGFIAVGYANGSNIVAQLVRFDASGNRLWNKIFNGSNNDYFNSVQATSDGGYIAVGWSNSVDRDLEGLNKGGYDAIAVKYDTYGSIQWKRNFGGTRDDRFFDVRQTSDGGYIAVGSTLSDNGDLLNLNLGIGSEDGVIVKYDSTGNVTSKKTLGGSYYDFLYSVAPTSDGGFVVAGYSGSTDGEFTHLNKGGNDAVIKTYPKSTP